MRRVREIIGEFVRGFDGSGPCAREAGNDEGRALGRGLDADFSATDQKVVLTVAVARYEAMFDDRVPVF